MKIVNRYFIKEVNTSFLAVLGVLLVIFASKHFVRYMSDAAAGELPTYMIVKLLSLFTLSALVLMIPLALFIAILISLGRMYKDSEMTALEACGIGVPHFMKTAGYVAVFWGGLVAVIALWLGPWSEERQYEIRDEAAVEAEFSFLEAGRFHEIRDGAGVFYIEKMSANKKRMQNVFVYLDDAGKVDIFSAKSGRQKIDKRNGVRYIILEDGFRFEALPQNKGYRIHEYQESGIRIAQRVIEKTEYSVVAWPTAKLLNDTGPQQIAELQWRLSMPIAVFLLTFIAVLLSRTNPRQGRFANLFLALLVFIGYMYLLMLSRSWIKSEQISPYLGMWWVHGLGVVFLLLLMVRQFGVKWLFLRNRTK